MESLIIERDMKDMNKSRKEQINNMTRSSVVLLYQSMKQTKFYSETDNKMIHECDKLENSNGLDFGNLLTQLLSIPRDSNDKEKETFSCNETEMEVSNRFTKAIDVILQAVRSNTKEQAENQEQTYVKELQSNSPTSLESDKEKCDQEKTRFEKDVIDDINASIAGHGEDLEKECVLKFDIPLDLHSSQASISSPKKFLKEGISNENIDGQDDEGRKKALFSDTNNDTAKRDSGDNSTEYMNAEQTQFLSNFQLMAGNGLKMELENISEITEEMDEDFKESNNERKIPQERKEIAPSMKPVSNRNSLVSSENHSANPTAFLQEGDEGLIFLMSSMNSQNDDDSYLNFSFSYLNENREYETMSWNPVEVEVKNILTHYPQKDPFSHPNGAMTTLGNEAYQIDIHCESNDMNESGHGFTEDPFCWPSQAVKGINVNEEGSHNIIKYDNLLKKMPHSMDNRFSSASRDKENVIEMNKNDLLKIKNPCNKKQTFDKPRNHHQAKKHDISKSFRRRNKHSECDNPDSTLTLGQMGTNYVEKDVGCPLMNCENRPFDNKHCLPERRYIQLHSCKWRCRRFMNGQYRSSGSGSNDDSGHVKRTHKRDGEDNQRRGRQNDNGNGGNGDNNGDGDKDKWTGYRMKPNIVTEEEDQNSEEENNPDVEEIEDSNHLPRPPDNFMANEQRTANHAESKADGTKAAKGRSDPEHSSLSIDELCLLLGQVACRPYCNVFDGPGHALNMCFTKIIHQLQWASYDVDNVTECQTCLLIERLFRHLASSEDHRNNQCSVCRQIRTLIIHHIELCITQIPPQIHRTSTDLCYKICHSFMWDIKILKNDPNLNRMIVELCSDTLKRLPDYDILNLNDELTEQQELNPELNPVSHNVSAPANANCKTSNGRAVKGPSAAREANNVIPVHATVVRKNSNHRRLPDIPPSIPEETMSAEKIPLAAVALRDPKANQPSPSLIKKTQDDEVRVRNVASRSIVSMPEGTIHDTHQFHSFVDQPRGIAGIGEVVVADPDRLCLVARHWQGKREECERTNQQPSQLREEGVILFKYKDKFRVLGTRYQQGSQWEILSILGFGMYGKCFLAKDLETGHQFCVKKIDLLHYESNELCLWADLDDPHIVQLYGAIRHGYIVYIFEEFIDGGNLGDVIKQQKAMGMRLSHWTAINYFQKILKGLAYLHSRNILHEDIKAENILLRSNTPDILLTDFGISRRLQGQSGMKNKLPAGTATHFSPEKATSVGHGFPADVWAAVCVLVYMMSGNLPWQEYLERAGCLNFIIYMKPPPMGDLPVNIQGVVKDLIVQGLVKDPENRPSAQELLKHPAFQILNVEVPESYYSTLMTGLTSVETSYSVKMSESEPSITQRSEDGIKLAQSPLEEDTVLYSLSIPQGIPPPHLSGLLDSISHMEESEKPHAILGPEPASRDDSAPGIDNNAKPSQNDVSAINADFTPRENAAVGTQFSPEQDVDLSLCLGQTLIHMPNLEDLLPSWQLDDGDKKYFQDTYDSRLFALPHSNLEVYKPNQPAQDMIPHLSIFNGSLDTEASSGGGHTPLPNFDILNSESFGQEPKEDLRYLAIENPSSLEELLSDEPFLPGPRNEMDNRHSPSNYNVYNVAFGTLEAPLNLVAAKNPVGLGKRSDVSFIQRKKPQNLTLDVSGQSSQDGAHCLSDGKKETASSSVTGSSNNSSSHIYEQQDREFKDLISSQGSDNGHFRGRFPYQVDSDNEDELSPPVAALDIEYTNRPTDEPLLEGKKVTFLSEDDEELMSYWFVNVPKALRRNISEIKRQIQKRGYRHFKLEHMNGQIVSFSSNLECEQLKVKRVEPGDPCICVGCRYS